MGVRPAAAAVSDSPLHDCPVAARPVVAWEVAEARSIALSVGLTVGSSAQPCPDASVLHSPSPPSVRFHGHQVRGRAVHGRPLGGRQRPVLAQLQRVSALLHMQQTKPPQGAAWLVGSTRTCLLHCTGAMNAACPSAAWQTCLPPCLPLVQHVWHCVQRLHRHRLHCAGRHLQGAPLFFPLCFSLPVQQRCCREAPRLGWCQAAACCAAWLSAECAAVCSAQHVHGSPASVLRLSCRRALLTAVLRCAAAPAEWPLTPCHS